jgi:hypothetical protein
MCVILCHCPALTDVTLRYPSVWRCYLTRGPLTPRVHSAN